MKKLFSILFISAFMSCGGDAGETQPAAPVHAHDLRTLQNEFARYPDSLMLGQELIQAWRNNGQYDSAIKVTQSLIQKDTGNAYLWNIMATLTYETGDTAGTIHALEKAVAIYPLPDYYVALATVYAEMKNKNALEIADALLQQPEPNTNKDDAYFIKGLYYNYIGEPAKAIRELDSAIMLNYTFMYAYREKAIALYQMKKYRDAIQVLKRAVTLQNNFDEGYYWLGKSYEKLNKKDSAIYSYQNALLYDKNYTEAREALDRLKNQKN